MVWRTWVCLMCCVWVCAGQRVAAGHVRVAAPSFPPTNARVLPHAVRWGLPLPHHLLHRVARHPWHCVATSTRTCTRTRVAPTGVKRCCILAYSSCEVGETARLRCTCCTHGR